MHHHFWKRNGTHGQALLVLVLLIALVITVVTSVSYRLTTETQNTKSQEENVRALAAADSGIEQGISLVNQPGIPANVQLPFSDTRVNLGTLQGIDPQRSSVTIQDATGNRFVSPDILQDDTYTFYVSNYPEFNQFYTDPLTIYFGSEGQGSCNGARTTPVVEVTIIYGNTNNQTQKILYEPCNGGPNSIGGPYNASKILPRTHTPAFPIDGTSFSFSNEVAPINMALYPQAKILIVRTLFINSRFGFTSGAGNLPIQGKRIRSEAISNTGASKVVRLLQTYPQIPADFFVTTF